jgi:sporulation protein YlmC with PRC-barrel domain
MRINLLTGAIALGLTQLAAAQSSAAPNQAGGDPRPTANAQAGEQQQPAGSKLRDVRLSQLIGRDVRDTKGEDLGDIKDLVIDLQSGQVKYAIVEFGGFMGVGEKLFAFPLSAFRQPGTDMPAARGPTADKRESAGTSGTAVDRDGRRHLPATGMGLWSSRNELVLNTDKTRLEKAPGFEQDRWPDFGDVDFRSRIDRYWGEASEEGQISKDQRADQMAQRDRTQADRGAQRDKEGAGTWRASELLDADVVAQDGQDIGEIEDLVVDAQGGALRYAVVEFEKGWFEADKLVSVPTNALSPRGEDELVFNGTKDQLAQAPAFDRDKWPDLNEPRYRSGIDRFVGGWGGGTAGSAPMARPADPPRGTGSTAAGGQGGSGSTATGGDSAGQVTKPNN